MDNWKYLLDTINTAAVCKESDFPEHLARILRALGYVVAERGDAREDLVLERLAQAVREDPRLQ